MVAHAARLGAESEHRFRVGLALPLRSPTFAIGLFVLTHIRANSAATWALDKHMPRVVQALVIHRPNSASRDILVLANILLASFNVAALWA